MTTEFSESKQIMEQLIQVHRSGKIDAGRNIQAGYYRGWGLEYGEMSSIISSLSAYRDALAKARDRGCMLPENKLQNLFIIILFGLESIQGDIIELGSYKGGSAVFMADLVKTFGRSTRVWALDTFAGMPATDPVRDLHNQGDFADTSYEDFKNYSEKMGLDSHLHIVKGNFDQTLDGVIQQAKQFSLAHIDCDIYEAVKYSITGTWPYLANGAYIILDDALQSSCIGALQAAEEELVSARGLRAEQAFPHLVYRKFNQ
jgi:predicted O-methyltransferase YrrM